MLRLRARLLIQDFQQAGAFERPMPSSPRLATLRSEGRRWLDAFGTLSRRLPSSALASTLPVADLLSRLTHFPTAEEFDNYHSRHRKYTFPEKCIEFEE